MRKCAVCRLDDSSRLKSLSRNITCEEALPLSVTITLDVGGQRLEQSTVRVESRQRHLKEAERELQPDGNGDIPFAAVQTDTRVGEPAVQQNGQNR